MLVPVFGAVEQLPRFVMFFLAGVTFYLYRDVIPQSGILALLALAAVATGAAVHRFELALAVGGTT